MRLPSFPSSSTGEEYGRLESRRKPLTGDAETPNGCGRTLTGDTRRTLGIRAKGRRGEEGLGIFMQRRTTKGR